MPEGKTEGGEEDDHLDHIRPDDSTNAAECGVYGSENGDDDQGGGIEPELIHGRDGGIDKHLPAEDEQHGGHPETCAACQKTGDEEDGGGAAACFGAEADLQEFIHADNTMAVVGGDENCADHHAGEQVARHELDVGVVAQGVAFAGSAEEGAGTDLRREDGGEDGPPCDLAIAQGETFHAVAFAALRQTDADDQGEVTEDDERVEEVRHGVCGAKSRCKAPHTSREQPGAAETNDGRGHARAAGYLETTLVSSFGSARTMTRSSTEVPRGDTMVISS